MGRGGSSAFHLSGSGSRELMVPFLLISSTLLSCPSSFRQLHGIPLSGYVIVCSVILLFKENQVAFLYVEDNVLEAELWDSP